MRLRINDIQERYEIAYHNYAEAKHAHQVQNNLFKPVHSVKTSAYYQNSNVQWYFHIYKAQKS